MAILSQLEYRFNLFTDAVLQPILTAAIEVTLWWAILASTATGTLGGFSRSSYLAYALWAAFFARVSANWMYEYKMMEEIESGSVNSVLARPISFYEYYLGQFMGYKILTTVISFVIPVAIVLVMPGPTQLERLPLACFVTLYYLVFVHTISFALASFGFFFNRVYSLTVAKNIALWVLSGELFPLDLVPDPFRHYLIALPFSNAVYIPVSYVTGRIEIDTVIQGLLSTTIGLVVVGGFCLGGLEGWTPPLLGNGRMIRKHAALIWAFFRASAVSDLEYRMNIVGKVVTDIIWYGAQLSVFEVLFRQTSSIAGWTIETTRVFMGVLFVVDATWMLIFQENLDKLSDKVRKGELDLLLAKPVNAQFMMSFQRFSTPYILNIFFTFAYLVWALDRVPGDLSMWRLASLLISIPCALATIYGVRFFFSAQALIFTRAENLTYVWYQFYRLGTRPDALYPPWLRYVVLSIIPVGFIASVPARLILETPSPALIAASIFLATVLVFMTTRFWRFALRFYSSASS